MMSRECDLEKAVCFQGDSGGPLIRLNSDGLYELVGLTSWGIGCASDTPGVYADVYFYRNWIENNKY